MARTTNSRKKVPSWEVVGALVAYSGSEGGDCVEVAAHPAAVHVRDSELGDAGPVFTVSPAAWGAFVGGATA